MDCAIFAACKSSHHHREAPRCTNSCSKPQKIELVGNRDAKKHNERMKNNTVECSLRQVQIISHFKERILAQHNNSRKFLKGSDEFFNIFFTQWIGLHYWFPSNLLSFFKFLIIWIATFRQTWPVLAELSHYNYHSKLYSKIPTFRYGKYMSIVMQLYMINFNFIQYKFYCEVVILIMVAIKLWPENLCRTIASPQLATFSCEIGDFFKLPPWQF